MRKQNYSVIINPALPDLTTILDCGTTISHIYLAIYPHAISIETWPNEKWPSNFLWFRKKTFFPVKKRLSFWIRRPNKQKHSNLLCPLRTSSFNRPTKFPFSIINHKRAFRFLPSFVYFIFLIYLIFIFHLFTSAAVSTSKHWIHLLWEEEWPVASVFNYILICRR